VELDWKAEVVGCLISDMEEIWLRDGAMGSGGDKKSREGHGVAIDKDNDRRGNARKSTVT